ncbi:hypothetical protein AOA80_03520 [Methanomassiliicoccales archaeon RumEn M1]|nr:hypothetical protein AOA80_03520 [Methanomassiliicoccales archaeon RumEn M1]
MSTEDVYRNINGPRAKIAFSVLLLLLVGALLKALLTGHVFWSLIATWILLIMLTPEFGGAILSKGRPLAATIALAGLFVLYLFLGPARPSVTDLNSMLWAVPGNVTVFGLVLTTLLVVNERGHGHMARQFLMVVTLVSYMTVVLMQGPIDHYVGMLAGRELVAGNDEFMRYFMVSTAVGVVLAFGMVNYMRGRAGSMINPGGVDWEG